MWLVTGTMIIRHLQRMRVNFLMFYTIGSLNVLKSI